MTQIFINQDDYSFGDRYTNIIHTKLRHNCALNSDLYRCNIIDSPLCSCGKAKDSFTTWAEDCQLCCIDINPYWDIFFIIFYYHFFFQCTQYSALRNDIFNEIFPIENLNIVNTYCKHLFGMTVQLASQKISSYLA